ncbi:hypothetical protein ACH4OY_17530 [Micromonospora rubida]|uniref:Uncharacterized protein n=1 Tax=Micromonospora rubida TaxID=2697657 RepID=A0ABW7SL80_9ACTN
MTWSRTALAGARARMTRVGALVAGLLLAGGCSQAAGEVTPEASPSTVVAMRLDAPKRLLDTWPESTSRISHDKARQLMALFKTLLDGEPTSAVGSAYAPLDERRTILVSGVSGVVPDPVRTVDGVFAGLPRFTDVKLVPPGPLGGETRCGRAGLEGVDVVVCVWVDQDTIGIVSFLGLPPKEDTTDLFLRVRAQLEHPAA